MTITFDIDGLNKIISDASARSGGQTLNKEDYTKIAYMPDGNHLVRIFLDKNNELFRNVSFHKVLDSNKKCHCPNQLNKDNSRNPKWADFVQGLSPAYKEEGRTRLPDCEICKLAEEAKEINQNNAWTQNLGRRFNILIYMSVYKTNAPGDYWQANENTGWPCVVVGSNKLKKSLVSLLESLSPTAGSYLTTALNPTLASPPFMVSSSRGAQGSVNISTIPGANKPPIFEGDSTPVWWRPLSSLFLDPVYKLEDYEEVLEAAHEVFNNFKQANSNMIKPAEHTNVKTNTSPINISTGSSFNKDAVSSKVIETQPTSKETVNKVKDTTPTNETIIEEDRGQILAYNQVKAKSGDIITLPEAAVERGCWGNFDSSDEICIANDCNLMCMLQK